LRKTLRRALSARLYRATITLFHNADSANYKPAPPTSFGVISSSKSWLPQSRLENGSWGQGLFDQSTGDSQEFVLWPSQLERGAKVSDVVIHKELTPAGGRYVARIAGVAGEGQLVFTTRGPNLISADHTEAPDTMRGTGAALALVEHMVADARANGFKIIPVCPYVKAQYKRHADWNDVMTVGPSAAAV